MTDRERPDRPNILFLMSDEHRADVAGFASDQIVRTPNLDWLAASGAVFERAYTPSPICIPGRQSIMAGQFPSTTGCRVYGDDLAPGSMTFARRLAQYAYASVASGKLHHMGADQMQGWTRRMAGDIQVGSCAIADRQVEEFIRHERPTSLVKWMDAKEIARAGIGDSHYAREDRLSVQGALDYIDEHFTSTHYDREQPERPLLLKVSLNAPHYPYATTSERFGYYLNRVVPFANQAVSTHPFLRQRQVTPGVDVSAREIRRAVAACYGMVETLDAQFGTVLERLQHVGQDIDDWIIVYTSDHGEMLGEHGVWEKQKFYEGSVRVPLIIRHPKTAPAVHRVPQNVNLCDLFATLCDLTGIPAPAGLDSRSLVPLLRGDASSWDDESISQFGLRNLMVKRGQLKYQWYGADVPEVLFDLEQDPAEMVDVANHPVYADALHTFRARRDDLGYGSDPELC